MYKVYQDVEVASKLELAGTPTFFVNGFRIRGFVPEEGWQEILKKVIEYVNQPKQ
jgi:predicted DsbA family dithiol-disulfide isomerase